MKTVRSKITAQLLIFMSALFLGSESQGANLEISFVSKNSESEIFFDLTVNATNDVKAFGLNILYDPLLLKYKSFV